MKTTKQWFEQAVPNPTSKNFHTQIGVHTEEVLEAFEALEVVDKHGAKPNHWQVLLGALKMCAEDLKSGELIIVGFDAVELLDGLLDQRVTAVGIAHMVGFEFDGATAEVDASNFSKFVEGKAIFDESRKIKKGPDFYKPTLAPFIPADPEAILDK